MNLTHHGTTLSRPNRGTATAASRCVEHCPSRDRQLGAAAVAASLAIRTDSIERGGARHRPKQSFEAVPSYSVDRRSITSRTQVHRGALMTMAETLEEWNRKGPSL
jgi:hypothetical protein